MCIFILRDELIMFKHQKLCVWSGVIFMALFGLGWWILAGFLPPPSPLATGVEVAGFYQENTWSIRLGLLIAAFSCTFYYPWIAVISVQLKRIEGPNAVYSWTQALSGATGAFIIYFPMLLWMVVSFRADRDPELMLLLNDLGWLMFTTTLAPFVAQNLSIALAILSDKSSTPVFPRWLGFYNIAVTSIFFPVGLILFFKTGPFAWDGMLAFWIPLVDFFIWMIVMTVFLFKAINQQR